MVGDGDKQSHTVIQCKGMCSLRKLCSFVSHFSGASRKTLIFRRAVVQRVVSHLAQGFFAGCNGGTSTV